MELETSIIQHPPSNPFIMRRKWVVQAIRENYATEGKKREDSVECGAEILSVIEYHTNNNSKNRILKRFMEQVTIRKGYVRDTGLWLPYSVNYLEELLLGGRGRDSIIKGLDILQSISFIDSKVPQDIKEFYQSGMTKWYALNLVSINAYLGNNPLPKPAPIKTETPADQQIEVAKNDKAMVVNIVCGFHRHIHGKKDTYVYDKKRQQVVRERVDEKRSFGEMAQAIIGNVLSPYHQGHNERNKVYDDVDLIFRDAKNFERFVGYAESHNISEQDAFKELETFLSSKTSQYSKLFVKTAQNGLKAQETVLDASIMEQYSIFSSAIAPFIVSSLSILEIMKAIREDEHLQITGKTLVNAEVLEDTLLTSVKMYGTPSQASCDTVKKFSKSFAELQKLNK